MTTTPSSSMHARFGAPRNRSMPPSVVIPVLGYPDVPVAASWSGALVG